MYDEHPWSHKKGLTIRVFNNNIEGAITQLKRRCNSEGINKELRKRKHYEPPSVVRRRKMAEAVMRWRKKEDIINEVVRPKRKAKKKLQKPIQYPNSGAATQGPSNFRP
jgi:small subunit ribosomal protein S21